jgi:putative sterol carrier protein
MSYTFPSQEWVAAFKDQINASEEYKQSAATWEAGDICLVVNGKPEVGLAENFYIWLDVDHGECRDAKAVDADVAAQAKFTITADYHRWQQVLQNSLDPVTGIMMGQIKVKGDLMTLMKYTKAAKDMIACGAKVESQFLGQ